jgi:hypothetical protein
VDPADVAPVATMKVRVRDKKAKIARHRLTCTPEPEPTGTVTPESPETPTPAPIPQLEALIPKHYVDYGCDKLTNLSRTALRAFPEGTGEARICETGNEDQRVFYFQFRDHQMMRRAWEFALAHGSFSTGTSATLKSCPGATKTTWRFKRYSTAEEGRFRCLTSQVPDVGEYHWVFWTTNAVRVLGALLDIGSVEQAYNTWLDHPPGPNLAPGKPLD